LQIKVWDASNQRRSSIPVKVPSVLLLDKMLLKLFSLLIKTILFRLEEGSEARHMEEVKQLKQR
jgi:hypothetical protein